MNQLKTIPQIVGLPRVKFKCEEPALLDAEVILHFPEPAKGRMVFVTAKGELTLPLIPGKKGQAARWDAKNLELRRLHPIQPNPRGRPFVQAGSKAMALSIGKSNRDYMTAIGSVYNLSKNQVANTALALLYNHLGRPPLSPQPAL